MDAKFVLLLFCYNWYESVVKGTYVIEKPPYNATVGIDYTLTCKTTESTVLFRRDLTIVCIIINTTSCEVIPGCSRNFTYSCDRSTNTYKHEIPGLYMKDDFHDSYWLCADAFEATPSDGITVYVNVPVEHAFISQNGTNDTVSIVVGDSQIFNCTTDAGRPAAWIQWYIGSDNVTYQAAPQTPQPQGNKFISSSSLEYTGNDKDHSKVIYCEAVNIDGGQRIKSNEKSLNVLFPVQHVSISPNGTNDTVSIVGRDSQIFTCTTDSGRPAAWIQWYIGSVNVTDKAIPQTPQPDGNKFISSSTLVYTGKDVDHNKVVYCEAVNIDGEQKVTSSSKRINILVPITAVTISSPTNGTLVRLMKGDTINISCTTDFGRPHAFIQWYIGGTNMTREASNQVTLLKGNTYITQSLFSYTGNANDNGLNMYCVAGNVEEMKNIQSDKMKIEILCCEMCNQGTDAKSFLSYAEGIGIGVSGLILLEGTIFLVIYCIKKIRRKSKEKQSEHYEKPDKTQSKPNPYNELGEINLESMSRSNDIENITTYEEIGTSMSKEQH